MLIHSPKEEGGKHLISWVKVRLMWSSLIWYYKPADTNKIMSWFVFELTL